MSDTAASERARPKVPKTVTIFVNTRPHVVEKKDEITFDEVVLIAYPTTPPGGNVAFSVMWERGHGNAGGTLVEGQSVKVKDGMRFDVTATDRS